MASIPVQIAVTRDTRFADSPSPDARSVRIPPGWEAEISSFESYQSYIKFKLLYPQATLAQMGQTFWQQPLFVYANTVRILDEQP